jgi:hypothetical protein
MPDLRIMHHFKVDYNTRGNHHVLMKFNIVVEFNRKGIPGCDLPVCLFMVHSQSFMAFGFFGCRANIIFRPPWGQ